MVRPSVVVRCARRTTAPAVRRGAASPVVDVGGTALPAKRRPAGRTCQPGRTRRTGGRAGRAGGLWGTSPRQLGLEALRHLARRRPRGDPGAERLVGPDELGWVAPPDGPVGPRPGAHGTRRDHAAVADPDPRHDGRAGADEAVAADLDAGQV